MTNNRNRTMRRTHYTSHAENLILEAGRHTKGSTIICSYRDMEALAGLEGVQVLRLNDFDNGTYTHEVLYMGYRFMTSSEYRIAQRNSVQRQTEGIQ